MRSGFSIRGYTELMIAAVIWGVTYVLLKYALIFLSPEQLAFSRFLIASVVFLPLFFIFREKYSRKEVLNILYLVITGVLGYQLLFIIGEQGVSAGDASFIGSFEPIFIVFLSISMKEEKFSWLLLIGLLISTTGLVFLMRPSSITMSQLFSVFLILLSALSWGIYTVVGKNLLRKHNPLNVSGFVSMLGALALAPFAGSGVVSLFHVHYVPLILSLIVIGIGGTFFGYYLWFDGLRQVKPSIAGTTLYFTPFVTVVVASLIISEPIMASSLIGGTLIIAGVAISSLTGNRE